MASERKHASTPKRTKATVAKPRPAKDVIKDLRTGIKDLQAIDHEHPWVRLLNEVVTVIREDHLSSFAAIKCVQEGLTAALLEITRESREGKVQVLGELEQIRTHLARFIDQGIRERGRDERIEAQLAGINERLRERSKVDRVLHHGKMVTVETLSREATAMEQAKDLEIATLRNDLDATRRADGEWITSLIVEVDRLRSELKAARETAASLDHRRMPPPRKSWRTTVAENVTAAPID